MYGSTDTDIDSLIINTSSSSMASQRARFLRGQVEGGEPEPIADASQVIAGIFAIILSLTSIALTVAWLYNRGGFGVSGSSRFNLHPLSMILAFEFLLTNGILAWRIWPFSHTTRKTLHFIFNLSAVGLVGLGLWAVLTSQLRPYGFTPHSWFGFATSLILACQALMGLGFLLPRGAAKFKQSFIPIHAWLGLATYTMGILTVTTGIMNLSALFMTRGVHHYYEPPASHTHENIRSMRPYDTENTLAMCLGLFCYATLFFTLYAAMPRRMTELEMEEEEETTGSRSLASRRGVLSEYRSSA